MCPNTKENLRSCTRVWVRMIATKLLGEVSKDSTMVKTRVVWMVVELCHKLWRILPVQGYTSLTANTSPTNLAKPCSIDIWMWLSLGFSQTNFTLLNIGLDKKTRTYHIGSRSRQTDDFPMWSDYYKSYICPGINFLHRFRNSSFSFYDGFLLSLDNETYPQLDEYQSTTRRKWKNTQRNINFSASRTQLLFKLQHGAQNQLGNWVTLMPDCMLLYE